MKKFTAKYYDTKKEKYLTFSLWEGDRATAYNTAKRTLTTALKTGRAEQLEITECPA